MISAGFGALPIRPNVFTRLFASIRLCLCGAIISNSIYISGPEQVTISPVSICVWGLFVLVVVDGCFVYLFITKALAVVHLKRLLAHRHHEIRETFILFHNVFVSNMCIWERGRNVPMRWSLSEEQDVITRKQQWFPIAALSIDTQCIKWVKLKESLKVKWWHHTCRRYFLW